MLFMKIQNLIDVLREFNKDAHIYFTINGVKLDYETVQPVKHSDSMIQLNLIK